MTQIYCNIVFQNQQIELTYIARCHCSMLSMMVFASRNMHRL